MSVPDKEKARKLMPVILIVASLSLLAVVLVMLLR